MRFSPPPLPRSLPFLCPHVFIRVCIRLRGRRQKERDRRWGEEGEGNSLFSPSPSPTLSLFVPATNTRYLFMKRLSKPCYTSFTFSIGLSLGKLIPPPPHTHTHFQTPFQRNLLTLSGIPRREISREQLPTPELLEE